MKEMFRKEPKKIQGIFRSEEEIMKAVEKYDPKTGEYSMLRMVSEKHK